MAMIRLPDETRDKLKALAASENRPMTAMVDEMMKRWNATQCPECRTPTYKITRCPCKSVDRL